jgi:hypothetical protein
LANDYHRRSSPVQQLTDRTPDDAMKRGSVSPQPDIPLSASKRDMGRTYESPRRLQGDSHPPPGRGHDRS